MDTILNFLTNLKLSLTQWISVTAAATIGFLVVALKIQGGRLHKAQVDLLEANMRSQDKEDDDAVQAARMKFAEALREFNKTAP